MSRFLTQWYFCANLFSVPDSKKSCCIICTVREFSNKILSVFIVTQTRKKFDQGEKKLEGSTETLGGAAETVQKDDAKIFMQG